MPVETVPSTSSASGVSCRVPDARDGAAVWGLVRDAGSLDLNSSYAYLLWCSDFALTSAVAEHDGQIVGALLGYRPPQRNEALFVWQVASASGLRGTGVATRMILDILRRETNSGIRYVEATVTGDNAASRAYFTRLAERLDTGIQERSWFLASDFPDGHAAEPLLRVGPFDADSISTTQG